MSEEMKENRKTKKVVEGVKGDKFLVGLDTTKAWGVLKTEKDSFLSTGAGEIKNS